MIHAGLNSRGHFYSAKDTHALQDAITSAIIAGLGQTTMSTGVATSAMSILVGGQIYTTEYDTISWFGDVKAYNIDATGHIDTTKPAWQASTLLPAPSARNIVTMGEGAKSGVAFTWDNIKTSNSLLPLLTPPTAPGSTQSELVDYIRGDDTNAGVSADKFRTRTKPLPDFVNSTPTLVGNNLTMGAYLGKGLPNAGGGASYQAFLDQKAKRTPLLFVGGNGGMLHAFNADTSATAGSAGVEAFAYIPRGALPNLQLLASQDFASNHHFFIDGPLTEADAYITSPASSTPGDAWANILVGTMGAGGKSVFALDVTNTTSLGASNVLWEMASTDTNDIGTYATAKSDHLGYINSAVQVGYVQNSGGWYAFVGNGVASASGKAVLLVAELSTGKIVRTFELPNAKDAGTAPNGLSGVALMRNAQGEVIGAYAGDLHGQVWRFEFSGNNPADVGAWTVGYGNTPLYVARTSTNGVQMVSAAPAIFDMPKTSGAVKDSKLVVFGTGRLIETTDATDKSTNTIYAVLDEAGISASGTTNTSPANAIPSGGASVRDNLQQQNFLKTAPTRTNNIDLIQLSANTVSYSGTNKKYGWYLDLAPTANQIPGWATDTAAPLPKVVYQPLVINNLVYVQSVILPNAAGTCDSVTGSNMNLLLPVMNGGQLTTPVFDTNGDGVVNDSDNVGGVYINKANGPDVIRGDRDPTSPWMHNVDPSNMKEKSGTPSTFNACAAGGTGCPNQSITNRVWERIVKPPF